MKQRATLHLSNGTLESVTIHDKMFGKNGYGGIIHENGEFEFVDITQITTGTHHTDACEICEE